jgi:hypothetical protein
MLAETVSNPLLTQNNAIAATKTVRIALLRINVKTASKVFAAIVAQVFGEVPATITVLDAKTKIANA